MFIIYYQPKPARTVHFQSFSLSPNIFRDICDKRNTYVYIKISVITEITLRNNMFYNILFCQSWILSHDEYFMNKLIQTNVQIVFHIKFIFLQLTDDSVITLNEPNSKIRGHILKSYHGKDFYAFQDIPYAEAPEGENRFAVSITRLFSYIQRFSF